MENSTINIQDRKGQTITFYSYKGGVGRSMALVNIACLAARENKKILLIDCDLEAPGLHQFFKTSEEVPGFVDLMSDLNEWINTEENNDDEGYVQFMDEKIEKYISRDINPISSSAANLTINSQAVEESVITEFDSTVAVDLIKAGRFDSGYSEKLGKINWMDVYKKAPAFFRTFAFYLEKKYDYIFVDARTGLADTSGICTMLMPQKLVLVFALNNQNINGIVDVARQAIDYRLSSNDHRELNIYPLPSRIENSANPNLQQWIENYKGKFVKLFTEKYMLDECRLSPYFDRCFIQYYAIHAYGENIPALYESVASSNFITYNYNNFLTVLKKDIPAWEVISIEEELAIEKLANEHFRKALDLYYKKEYDKAIEEYSTAIGLKMDYADAYFNRGLSYDALGNFESAVLDYTKVIEIQSDAADAYVGLGNAKKSQEKFEEAIMTYDRAIEINPGFAEAYFNRANIKADLKRSEEALKDYNEAIKLKPDYASAFINRGVIEVEMQLYEDALNDYSRAIELKPDDAIAYYNKGIVKKKQALLQEALMYFDKAIVLKPDYADAYIYRGIVKDDLKSYEEALKDYDKAIEIQPDYALGYYNRGTAKENLKLFEEALKDYNKAIEIQPDFEDAINSRDKIKELLKPDLKN